MTDLQLLIAELRRQRDELEEEIRDCMMVRDFVAAAMHREVLELVQHKLYIFHHLEDPDHGRKARLRRFPDATLAHAVRRAERMKLPPGREAEYFAKMREFAHRHDAELAELEAKPRHFHLDSDEVLTYLEQLANGTVRELSLRLTISSGEVTIQAFRSNAEVCISIFSGQGDGFDGYTYPEGYYELRDMGFEVSAAGALKTIGKTEEREPYAILTLLSRIAFDVFRLPGDASAVLTVTG